MDRRSPQAPAVPRVNVRPNGGGGEIHGAGLIMAGGKKGLRAAVLNGGEGISVGDDNSG
jgi:hypothetical protein